MEDAKPPRKKRTRLGQPESVEGRRPGEEPTPASAERTGGMDEGGGHDSTSRQSPSVGQHQVTNQDEQEKITNAGENDVPGNEK